MFTLTIFQRHTELTNALIVSTANKKNIKRNRWLMFLSSLEGCVELMRLWVMCLTLLCNMHIYPSKTANDKPRSTQDRLQNPQTRTTKGKRCGTTGSSKDEKYQLSRCFAQRRPSKDYSVRETKHDRKQELNETNRRPPLQGASQRRLEK